jgi:hypothetical protein
MQSPAGARSRPRRAPLAALLATLALGAGAQAIAPAGAAAMVSQGGPSQASCVSVGGWWLGAGSWGTAGCYILLENGGGLLKVNEVSSGSGTAPWQPNVTPSTGLPHQIGADGAGSGGEKDSKGGSKGAGSGEVKAPAKKDKPKKDKSDQKKARTPQEMCSDLLRTLNTYKASIEIAVKEIEAYHKQGGSAKKFIDLVSYRNLLIKVFKQTKEQYEEAGKECLAYTGPAPEIK